MSHANLTKSLNPSFPEFNFERPNKVCIVSESLEINQNHKLMILATLQQFRVGLMSSLLPSEPKKIFRPDAFLKVL